MLELPDMGVVSAALGCVQRILMTRLCFGLLSDNYPVYDQLRFQLDNLALCPVESVAIVAGSIADTMGGRVVDG